MVFIRWLGKNISSLLLSFLLAVLVWVSAVLANDPNQEHLLPQPVVIDFYGKDPGLKIMGEYPTSVELTLMAPQSVWNKLEENPNLITARVDLSAIQAGEYVLPVDVTIQEGLVRLVKQDPEQVQLTLEPLVTKPYSITLTINGTPALGYKLGEATVSPNQTNVMGPASLVSKVKDIRTQVDISGISENLSRSLTVIPVDESGKQVNGVTLSPNIILFSQPVELLGGYRNVVVKVVTTGNVASGYRLTNYFPSPSSVILFSSDPQLVNSLPGYIETKPLDLTDADDDFEVLVELNLPDGITAVADFRVLVQVSVAAIETSMSISLPVEITGLQPGYEASLSPPSVDLILNGPVPVLNDLKPSDIRVKVDLSGFSEGIFQIIPVVDFLPPKVQKVSVLPTTVEVTILALPTPTPTPNITPTPTATQTATPGP
jgi:YbbR domain-containing protein